MTTITFLHRGENHCPRCGTVGNQKKDDEIDYLVCPYCDTEYTKELILKLGEKELTFENN